MKYNKRQFVKSADHKILHKIKKHWVIVSIALLGLLGSGTVTQANAVNNTNSTNNYQINQQLNSERLPNNQTTLHAHKRSNQSFQYNPDFQNQNHQRSSIQIDKQADLLHNGILQHALISSRKTLSSSKPNSSILFQPSATNNLAVTTPRVKLENWGRTQIKFISDGNHGNAGGDVAEVQPGAISDAFNEENNSDTTYNTRNSNQSSYIINRYKDPLTLPFDQSSTNWILKFAPQVTLQKNGGISKGDQIPQPGENSSDIDYTQGEYQTNNYQYLLSSVNRPLWNHFKTMDLTNLNTNNASDLSNMFTGDQALQNVILNNSNNPQLTNLQGMFADASQLRRINFNHFGTGQVQDMDSMFLSDAQLNHLDVSFLDTSHVTNMHGMFMSDFALSDIKGLNNWNTDRVTNLISTFARDTALSELSLNHWNTTQVHSMAGMFSGDTNLRNLDLGNLQTNRVSDMSSMFAGDKSLQNLNLTNFNTHNVRSIMPGSPVGGMSFMFNGDDNLHQLILGSQTALNRPNQNWSSKFFDRNVNANGNDTTNNLRSGQQVSGSYYSADYYNNILLFQQYFADEQTLADQALTNNNVNTNPQIHNQISQEVNQVKAIIRNDMPHLNLAARGYSKIINDFYSITNLVNNIKKQSNIASSTTRSNQVSSAARSADRSIEASYRASVAQSVTIQNSRIASAAASTADQKIAKSERNSVAQSVSISNQKIAASAAHSADSQIAASYRDSVSNSVAFVNQRIATSAAQSADQRIATLERVLVAQSIANQNRMIASSAARSADQSIANSIRNSITNSVAINNQRIARSAAQSTDQKIAEFYRNSVSNSVASANHQIASLAQHSANVSLASSEKSSISKSRSASAFASSQSTSKSLSEAYSAHIFQNDIDQINSYDQIADQYNQQALNNLNQINVSANVSLNSLKNDDLNKVTNDKRLISEDNKVVSNLTDNYNPNELNYEIGNANNQLSTARDAAQDAKLLINDLTSLKSRVSQEAHDLNSNNGSASHNNFNSSNGHQTSAGSDFHDSNSNPVDHNLIPSLAHFHTPNTSIRNAINVDQIAAKSYTVQINKIINNATVGNNSRALSTINHDIKMITNANQAIVTDQKHPNLNAESNANYELNQIRSANSNADLTILGTKMANANVEQIDNYNSSFNPSTRQLNSSVSFNVSNENRQPNLTNDNSNNNYHSKLSSSTNQISLINNTSTNSENDSRKENNDLSNENTDTDLTSNVNRPTSNSIQNTNSNKSTGVSASSNSNSSNNGTNHDPLDQTSYSSGNSNYPESNLSNRNIENENSNLNNYSTDPDSATQKLNYGKSDTQLINDQNINNSQRNHSITLPQTGEASSRYTTITIVLLTLNILGMLIDRKRHHD